MGNKSRDIRLQSLTLGAGDVSTVIPLGGEAAGISARISHGTVGSVRRGALTNIKEQPGPAGVPGVLTISVYPEDPGSAILRGLYNAKRLPGAAAVPLPGSAINLETGETCSWADSHFTGVADVPLGTASEIVTYVLELSGLVTAQVAV